jgi:DNA-binding SARP family transcriptional activator
MAKAEIRLLGGFEAYRADGSRAVFPTRKAEGLLAVLALAGGAARSRERLAGLLWGDRGEAQARHSLSQSLSSIRGALGEEVLLASRESVALLPGRLGVDVLAFLAQARPGAGFEALDAAAQLYRGPLLDGIGLREDGFEEWLLGERRRLHEEMLKVLRRLATAARARADDAAARDALERAVALEPLSEEAHRALLRLHLDHGRTAEAVRQYTACAGILRRELQVEPGPETVALWREALARGAIREPPAAPEGDAATGERKLATALALVLTPGPGAPADPEELEALLQAAALRAAEPIRRHGGRILRAAPEGISAVFGAPHALEDHAARACRAALDLLAAEAPRPDAVGLGLGLDSGEVVLHGEGAEPGEERGARIFGACLQRAARIAAAGGPGSLAATEATAALARGRLRFVPAVALPAGPGGAPLPLFRPDGTARPGDAGPRAAESELVERGAELAALSSAITPVAAGGGRLVALVGEAGVGKSRLVREFASRTLPGGWRVVRAAADPQTSDTAYATVAALLRDYFGLGEEAVGAAEAARIGAALRALDPGFADQAMVPLLALLHVAPTTDEGWASLEPARRRRRMVEAVQGLLHRHAAAEPVLLVIEDLHWLDPASRQVIESLAESLTAARLALLVNFRPEFAHGWAGLGHYRQFRIEPLSADGAQLLLGRLLGRHPSMAPLRDRLAMRAGGNPFFLEECVRAAAEMPGLLAEAPGAYRLAGDPDAVVLPATVQAVIGARIDRLAPEDKRLLQMASVVGSEPQAALLRVVSGLPEEGFEASLARLRSGEFLVPLRLVPDAAYRFRHALTHEVAYGSLLRQDRRELHLRVLRAMAPRDGAEPPVEILAFHATRAEAWEAAADYGRQAGMQAAARSANREAVSHYGQALAALRRLPESPRRGGAEVDLLLEIRNALFVLGEPEAIPAHLEEAARIATAIGDAQRGARVGLLLSGWYWQNGQHGAAAEAANRAIAVAAQGGDALLGALGLYRRGANLMAVGEYRAAAATLGEAIALFERHGVADAFAFGGHPYVFCCSFRAWALAELGEFAAARAMGAQGWDAALRRGNSYSQAVMSFGYGHALIRAGALEQAAAVLERGMELYRVQEVPSTYPWIAACLGFVRVRQGEPKAGLALLRHAVAPEVRRRGPLYAQTWLWLADAAALAGRVEEALAAARTGHAAAAAQGERGHFAWAERCLGDLLSASDPEAAAAHYRWAIDIATELGMQPQAGLARAGLARIAGMTKGG